MSKKQFLTLTDFDFSADEIIDSALETKAFEVKAKASVAERFEVAKKLFIKDFENDEVSQEITSGSLGTVMTSKILGYGTLFGFIGFEEGTDPVGDASALIESSTRLISILRSYTRKSKKGTRGAFQTRRATGARFFNPGAFAPERKVFFRVAISTPTLTDFKKISSLVVPDASTANWVKGIERGISGLGYFLHRPAKGRSGYGLQAKKPLSNRNFKTREYYSKYLKEFLLNMTKP